MQCIAHHCTCSKVLSTNHKELEVIDINYNYYKHEDILKTIQTQLASHGALSLSQCLLSFDVRTMERQPWASEDECTF